MSKIYVQVTGCVDICDSVESGMSDSEAQFYGVYIGSPGNYKHVFDSNDKIHAMMHANNIISKNPTYELDDKTFK